MGNLWTPWRLAYILSDKSDTPCVFCAALAEEDDATSLILVRGERAFVLLNRYPYNNGHVMIAPNAHAGSLGEAAPAALDEMNLLAVRVERALAAVYRADGLNLGMNLGKVAGAGVLGHLHLHVVPRWEGDTNFMAVLNDVRVIPERPEETWAKLRGRV